jgi:hypothetical protein
MASALNRTCKAFIVLTMALVAVAQAREKPDTYPQRVMIIRHAERPEKDDGSVHLSAEGQKRADELYHLFERSVNRPEPFPAPEVIFAAKDSKHSHRSVETVILLAKRLKVTINSNYRDEDFAELAQDILHNSKYAGKTILISWHHGMAPQLASKLGAPEVPTAWKGSVFDRVWQIGHGENGKASFRDRPQQLLSGDSDK